MMIGLRDRPADPLISRSRRESLSFDGQDFCASPRHGGEPLGRAMLHPQAPDDRAIRS